MQRPTCVAVYFRCEPINHGVSSLSCTTRVVKDLQLPRGQAVRSTSVRQARLHPPMLEEAFRRSYAVLARRANSVASNNRVFRRSAPRNSHRAESTVRRHSDPTVRSVPIAIVPGRPSSSSTERPSTALAVRNLPSDAPFAGAVSDRGYRSSPDARMHRTFVASDANHRSRERAKSPGSPVHSFSSKRASNSIERT